MDLQLPPNEGTGIRAPLPDEATLLQLLNISLKTPDYGVVNYRTLYVLLEYLLNRLNLGQDRVSLRERASREVLRDAEGRVIPGGVTSNLFNTGNSNTISPRTASYNSLSQPTEFLGVDPERRPGTEARPLLDGVIIPRSQLNIAPLTDRERISNLESTVTTLRALVDPSYDTPATGSGREGASREADAVRGEDLSSRQALGVSNKLESDPSRIDVFAASPATPAKKAVKSKLAGLRNATAGTTAGGGAADTQLGSDWAAQVQAAKEAHAAAGGENMPHEMKTELLTKRMDAAEGAVGKALTTIDALIHDVNDAKEIKDAFESYVLKMGLNPGDIWKAAGVKKLQGPFGERLTEGQLIELIQQQGPAAFVTWPDLRAALVDHTAEQEGASASSSILERDQARLQLSPIPELNDQAVRTSPVEMVDDQTSVSDKSGRSSKLSTESGLDSDKSGSNRSSRLDGEIDDRTKLPGDDGSRPEDGTPADVLNSPENNASAEKDGLKQSASGAAGRARDEPQRRQLYMDSKARSRSTSRRQSPTAARGTLPAQDLEGAADVSPNVEQESAMGPPVDDQTSRQSGSSAGLGPESMIAGQDGSGSRKAANMDVFQSLAQLGKLIKASKRFESRLGRIENALGGLLNKNEFKRMSDVLRSDVEKAARRFGSLGGEGEEALRLQNVDGEEPYGEGQQGRGRGGSASGGGSIRSRSSQKSKQTMQKKTTFDKNGVPIVEEGELQASAQDQASTNERAELNAEGTNAVTVEIVVKPLQQDNKADDAKPAITDPEQRPLSPMKPVGEALVLEGDGFATMDQIRGLKEVVDAHRHDWERMKNRLNTLHSEMASMNTKMKDQSGKTTAGLAKGLVQPQFQQSKTERASSGVTGPSRSEFEIFCRACAENFEMIEIRLSELEHLLDVHKQKIETLQLHTIKLQRDKADTEFVTSSVSQKADISQLDDKVDQPRFDDLSNHLHEKLVKLNGDLHEQGDYLHENMKTIAQRMEEQLNAGDYDNMIHETDRNVSSVLQRVTTIEKYFQVGDAAGSKKPIRDYSCISCDRPVDPTPNDKPSGWPHAYLTLSVRPHLDYVRQRMIKSSSCGSRNTELKFRNNALTRQLQRYIRQQECAEFKAASNHFGDRKFPHCNHSAFRPVGGKHTQFDTYNSSAREKAQLDPIKDRLDKFVVDTHLGIQFPRCLKSASCELPGFPDMKVSRQGGADKDVHCRRRKSQTNAPTTTELKPGMV